MHVPSSVCEWCNSSGLITVYHRRYAGSMTVDAEYLDSRGEVHSRREPGTLAAHCSCSLGAWMRERLDPEIQRRIPTLSDVIAGRWPYQLERPDFDEDQEGLSDYARAFVRRWKVGFGVPGLKIAPGASRTAPEDVGRALHERNEKLTAGGAA